MDKQWLEEHMHMGWLRAFPFSTHLPILIQCILRSNKPILEIGMGEFSTPILHLFSRTHFVVSIDHDEEMVDICKRKFSSPTHSILLSKDYQEPQIDDGEWGTVLIDHHVERIPEIKRVLPKADYVVVHDSPTTRLDEINCTFRRDFYQWITSVVSNRRTLEDLEVML